MIDFDAIGLHDLLLLEADGRHIEVAGWYHVEWITSGWGEHHLEVEILGTHKQPHSLRKGDVALIRRHIRAGSIPALIAVAEAAQHLLYVRRLRSENDRPMVVELGQAWDRLAKAVGEMDAP